MLVCGREGAGPRLVVEGGCTAGGGGDTIGGGKDMVRGSWDEAHDLVSTSRLVSFLR